MTSNTQKLSQPVWLTRWLTNLGRQLLLVPEAAFLLALLCLHAVLGRPPLLALLGLGLALWFVLRMSLLLVARQFLAQGDYARAEGLAQAAHMLYPYSADVHALLGSISLACGEATAAVASLRRAVAYFPAQASLYAALSAALLEAGQPREALAAAHQAVALDPSYGPAQQHLAAANDVLAEPAPIHS